MEVEEYVDIRYEFVDGNEMEARTTGSLLNTSVKTLTPTLTITQWKYKWSLSMLFQVVDLDHAVIYTLHYTIMKQIQHISQLLQEVGL